MENVSPTQLILNFILAGMGGFVGVRVAVAQLQVHVKTARAEIRILRKRTHAHSTLITILCGKTGVNYAPVMAGEDGGESENED